MKKYISLLALTLLPLFGGDYAVDASHSSVGFKIKHLMISNVAGTFDSYKGSFGYDEKSGTLTSLKGEIEAKTINTAMGKRDDHLRSADFFEVEKYPLITFEMTKADADSVSGKLTMKGVTKEVKLAYENGGTVKDPWGNTRAAFALDGKINRKDFGLTWNKALETGGVVVGDEVKMTIEIEGIAK